MSAGDFQVIDNEKIHISMIKKIFIKTYHQHGAQIDDDKKSNFCFGENLNYTQIENGYLEI